MRTLRKYEIKIPRNENYYIWSNHLTNVLRTKKRVREENEMKLSVGCKKLFATCLWTRGPHESLCLLPRQNRLT